MVNVVGTLAFGSQAADQDHNTGYVYYFDRTEGDLYLMDADDKNYIVRTDNGAITPQGQVTGLVTGSRGGTGDTAFTPEGTLPTNEPSAEPTATNTWAPPTATPIIDTTAESPDEPGATGTPRPAAYHQYIPLVLTSP